MKVARTVLKGVGAGNGPCLPDGCLCTTLLRYLQGNATTYLGQEKKLFCTDASVNP